MKLLLAFLLAFAASASAQTVTALSFRTVITISGTSITNSVNIGTNQFPAIQFAMDKWNRERTNGSPALPVITNYAHFIFESAKTRVAQATNDFDADIPKTLLERLSVISEADKAAIRAILQTY